MALPVFPASELDDAKHLLNVVGSFWATTYAGNFLVESLLYARGRLEVQAHVDLLELTACLSRFKTPVYHLDGWYCLTLRESALSKPSARFDSGYTFASGLAFDAPLPTPFFVWALPTGLVSVQVAMNRIYDADLTWLAGVDFFLRDSAVWFKANPFDDTRITPRPIFQDNEVVDRECDLWLYHSFWDKAHVYRQYGYVLGLNLSSSPNARDLVNAVYDGLVEGTTGRCIEQAFSALADVPLALSDETVQRVLRDHRGLAIVTDRRVYRFHGDSQVLVQTGDTVKAGDPLTDTLVFYEFNRGQVPSLEELRTLSVGKGFLANGYLQDLSFQNKDVPLLVEEDVDGYTKVSFELGGFPGDVTAFWDEVHARGIQKAYTLAMLLDQRPQGSRETQPTAAALPVTVNPLAFLLQNVFRDNVFVVKLKTWLFGPGALGMEHARVLRRLIPPHTACIILVELDFSDTRTCMCSWATPAATTSIQPT